MVEFALVLPMLLLCFLGVTELGRAVYYYNSISNLAREGARFGVVLQGQSRWRVDGNYRGTYSGIVAYSDTDTIVGAIASKAVIFDLSRTTVTIRADAGTWRALSLPLTVSVQYPFELLTANWIGVSPTITLMGQATMIIE